MNNHLTKRCTIALFILLVLGVNTIFAQNLGARAAQQPIDFSQELQDIVIVGADSTVEPLILIRLNARKGTRLSKINLDEERNNILDLGKFARVSVTIEERGSGPTLFIAVRQNPAISQVNILDNAFPEESVLQLLEQQNLLTPGAIYDTRRAQEAKETLKKIYRDNGYPFAVDILLEPEFTDAGVVLNYSVEGDRRLKAIRFADSKVMNENELREAFDYPVDTAGALFDYQRYQQAAYGLARAYDERGYRGSGLDFQHTSLQDGTLQVGLRELVIVGIDTLEVGISPEELSLGLGELFNYDLLLDDISRLSRGGNQDIRLEYPSTAAGEVRVILRAGEPDSSGVIAGVRVEGSTVFNEAELQAQLRLREGSTFSSELANEDYRRLRSFYEENGYALIGEPTFEYDENGRYVQRLREVRISNYNIVVEEGEEQRTRSDVILRYLPTVGSAYNRDEVREGLFAVAGTKAVEPTDFNLSFPDSEFPYNAVANISIRESRSRVFSPSLTYAPDSGLNAAVSYADSNFLGLGHNFNVGFSGESSDIGLRFGGDIAYTIPWLYVDFLDFKEVPTSISFSAFSTTSNNQTLTTGDGKRRVVYPNLSDTAANQVLIGEYARRDTGASLSFGRPLNEDLHLQLGIRGTYSNYDPEPNNKPCTIENNQVKYKDCQLPAEFALDYLPPNGFNTFISTGLTFDNRNQPAFPTEGVRAFAGIGLGSGNDFKSPTTNLQVGYNYLQLTGGVRTYLSPSPNQAFAFRLDVGHQLGGEYPNNRYFMVGNTQNENTLLRGFTRADIDASRSYAIGSLEYRYDFGLASAVTQTLIGIAFVDFGYASGIIDADKYNLQFPVSAGIGLQINIGTAAGSILPPIRFDYGFSERHPTGVLSFRLGYAF